MSQLIGGLGGSGGYSSSTATKKETQSGQQQSKFAQANTYSGAQQGLQDEIMQYLRNLIPGFGAGTLSPGVQALATSSAGRINRNSAQAGENLNRTFASRGMGRSGMAGKAALSTELGRQGALAENDTAAQGLELQQRNGLLRDALTAAFQSLGSTGDSSGSYSSVLDSLMKQSGWGFGVSGGVSGRF